MGKVALVTGGTRGIGAAISRALKKAGYSVAANYHGNDEAAKTFKKETRIPVYKWDVSDYVACEQGVVKVENEVGPVEVLINNAGISRDAMLQKMTHEQWSEVIRTNLDSLFNMTRPVINGMRERNFGRIVNIASINGQKGQLGLTNYSLGQGRRDRLHPRARARKRPQGHHRECDRARATSGPSCSLACPRT